MNTNSKYRKIVLIVLAVVLIAFLAMGAWLSLFNGVTANNFKNTTDTGASQTSAVQVYKEKPYIMAETEELARDYANKLGIPNGQYIYTEVDSMKIDADGVWKGMAKTTVIDKYVHLLLPNSVKKLDIDRSTALGTTSVKWLSITANTGSQLAEITRGTSRTNSVFGNGGGWLGRIDFTKATNLRTIPSYTFNGCDRLCDVALPDTLTSIEAYAFASNCLTHISLPSGLGADGAGLDVNAFNVNTSESAVSKKILEVELPSNANSGFESKVKNMTPIKDTYLNIYKKGVGRSWLVTTNDGFVFCKNTSRTSPLSTEMGNAVTVESVWGQISYAVNKWYLVNYRGPESGGDTIHAANDYMVRLPKQVDLSVDSEQRSGVYDYIDCEGNEVQNDFSSLAATATELGSNVAINGSSRVIAGTVGDAKLRYDIGQYVFYFRWVQHTTIPDDTVSAIGNYAFLSAPMWTFNCGNVEYIGKQTFKFGGVSAGLIFYPPSNNPFCASDGFSYNSSTTKRMFVYRNYNDYANRKNVYIRGLYKRMEDFFGTEGTLKFYTYLVDIVPNIGEWDTNAGAYKYNAIDDAKIQRLYTGPLANYDTSETGPYKNSYCYERKSDDTWEYREQILPALTEYTGYSKSSWFTSTEFNTKYNETTIGTSAGLLSLRNAGNDTNKTSVINMYAKKIGEVDLEDKIREYKNTSFSENDPIITGIPESISNNYTVSVTSYVDSSGVAKSYESIGSVVQEAGVYTLEIQPDAYYGEWDATAAPTMTVTVNKTQIDLGDYTIFRLGVTNGMDKVNLRPGKEVSGEQAVSLYKYGSSWFTDEQTDMGAYVDHKDGLWNSFVRAEGTEMKYSLTLVTNVVKDAHKDSDVFVCDFSNCTAQSESGEYREQFKVTLTDAAKNNYRLALTHDKSRLFYGSTNEAATEASVDKTWYIVKLNNWLTYQGESGNDARSYNMPSEWEFGSSNLPAAPAVALGSKVNIKFSLELTSPNSLGVITINDVAVADFGKYINSSMPVGSYRIAFSVEFEEDDKTRYQPFYQSFSFNVYEKEFTAEEMAAIDQIKGASFEYDMKQVTNTYLTNGVLFDLSALTDATKKTKLQDMLALGRTPQWNTARIGAWTDKTYDSLFDSNFKITYNLNRMWNNSYLSMADLLDDYPLNTPDVYTIYYQLTCKNRRSLISPNNNDRRLCYFDIIVYRTLTAPQGIGDIEYTGYEIYPEINYLNGELEFERAYYEASFPSSQDNVNHGDKKVILTISPENTQLYRWEKDASKNVAEISYKIVPANNSTTVPLYMAGWSWNSEITLDNIIWATQFGDAQDYTYTLVPVKNDNDDREALTDITKFGMASAGEYNLVAYCPADVNGNWKEYEQTISLRISPAGNNWVKSPSISTWTWNQYENFDWNASGAVSPIEIHAIPTYFASPKETGEQSADGWGGTGRFDFRIYSIDSTKTGKDMYNVVEFDNGDFHFQYATDSEGNFVKNGDHFVLPISVAKKLAGLPAGRYYLVATVYSHNNYTGLNNSNESFVQGAVPFTIASANNVWTNTITANDWEYSEFQMGYHLNAATAKYDTELTYSVCTGKTTEAVVVNGIKLENIKSTSNVAPGSTYTYAQLINMLNVGEYTLRVHGDQAAVNDREGINYLAIDDQREFHVTKAANTLTQTFAVFNYTIGTSTTDLIPKYTARFESDKVGYRISQNGSYVDGLSAATTSSEPIKIEKSLTYNEFLSAIAGLKSTASGSNYTVWWATSDGTNFEARSGLEVITVFLGQNSWLNDKVPTIEDWEYDGKEHDFDMGIIKLTHSVDLTKINLTYYNANFNEYTGQYTRGAALDSCPIDVGNYFVAVNVPNDDYYKGMSTDLFFRITAASNKFKTLPSIKNGGWVYSQLATGDIVICAPEHEEDNMMLTYVVYRDMGSGIAEERVATLQWELGDGFNNNDVVLEAFYARLNTFDVGDYKLYATISASHNYKEVANSPISFTITKATNAWKEGKAPTITAGTSWQWDNYQYSTWNDVETKFGNVIIYVDNNAVAMLSVSRYLSELGVGDYTMRFEVAGTNNYNSFTDSVTFSVTKNDNGWKDGESDATAFVHDWTWGEYNNDIVGGNPTWVEPAPKYGTPYASIYKGKDGVGGSLISQNIALYSLDILMNYLDAGDYYIIWSIAESANYKALTRSYINFKVEVNPNAWDTNKVADMHENDNPTVSEGIQYGWTWGEYGKDGGQYFTMPQAKFGTTVAKLTKVDKKTGAESIVFDGVSNELSIANVLANLDASRYILRWSAIDLQNSGNYKEIQYSKEFKFIINMGINSWTGDAPQISDWMWGEFKSSYWKAPGLTHGNPIATVTRIQPNGQDGDIFADGISSIYLNAILESLGVGKYKLEWSSNSEGNFEITQDDPDPLEFEVFVNANGWVNAPAITAPNRKWQWGLFTLGYWTMPSAKYHNNDLFASVYKVDGDYIYDVFNDEYDFSNCVEMDEITLDTMDRINDLSIGKYLVKVGVPKDTMGRYRGLESVVPFEIVPNENNFTSNSCYVNNYAYLEFRGYWRAPIAQFGEIRASIYLMENGVRVAKVDEVSTFDLNDALRELHTGDYQLDWTIVEDKEGNYLSHTRTSDFTVNKANNRWLSKPTIKDWAYGLYDSNSIVPTAMPLAVSDDVDVYFKIVNAIYGEIADFRAYAEKFEKDANGSYYDDGKLVLTADGYFTDVTTVEKVMSGLKPGIYHLLAYYPEMADYNRLDTNNDHLFEIRSIENKWVELPSIKSWIAGSSVSMPKGSAIHGEVKWTYYNAVYDTELGRYVIDGDAIDTDGDNPPEQAGKYILVASTEVVDGYAPLREEIFFEIFEKSLTGISGNLLLWIDISLATIASITAAVIIYTLLKARSRKDDDVFNG
ncbi:MAG: leucine-rich repeat domain-containing protein [Clostridia bacterium]|nr:leucine-rich repeat domain-containing protein [Clostridia bacterium]